MSSEFVDISTIDLASRTAEWRAVEVIYSGRFRVEKASRSDKFFILKSAVNPHDLISISLLHKEFELTYHLDHPSIRRAYGIEKIEGVGDTLVLEYIDGQPLDCSDVARLPKLARRKIVTDLLWAVDYIHSRQIIHRDLKPENILITHNGQNVKLIDLGFSDADNFYALKSPAGTDGYMAPEQRRGEPLDARADIYSLGIVFERYFADVVPRNVRRRCSDEKPARRHASVREVIAAIALCRKRKRLLVRFIIACFVLSMLVGIYLAWRQDQPVVPVDPTPEIDTVIVEVPSIRVDTVVVEKPASPTKSKPKSHPVSRKVEGGYTAVIPYPNAVEGYSITQLGAIANQTMNEIKKILDQDTGLFDSPRALKARLIPIAEKNFSGIPHTLQKQMVIESIEIISQRSIYLNEKREKSRTR